MGAIIDMKGNPGIRTKRLKSSSNLFCLNEIFLLTLVLYKAVNHCDLRWSLVAFEKCAFTFVTNLVDRTL